MIVLWFILGLALIFGIARYNESNKLFWTLLLAYVLGFAGAKMYLDVTSSEERSNDVLTTQVHSTQDQVDLQLATLLQLVANLNALKVTDSALVSQNFAPVLSENNITLSKIYGRTRDQPNEILKPPDIWLQKDTSTLHDAQ